MGWINSKFNTAGKTLVAQSGTLATSSNCFKCRMLIYKNNTNNTAYALTQLWHDWSGHTNHSIRYQHHWTIDVNIDGVTYTKKYNGPSMSNLLPNDCTAAGVVSAGHLNVPNKTWMQWGSYYQFTLNNDGKKHTFKFYMRCLDTVPFKCPNVDSISKITAFTYTAPTPAKPKPGNLTGLTSSFNERNRTLTLTWNAATNTSYYIVNKSGARIAKTANTSYSIQYDALAHPGESYNVVPYNGDNVAGTGASISVDVPAAQQEADNAYVYVDQAWQPGTVYIYIDDAWIEADAIYVYDGTSWQTN